jgi:Outer membrane receptor for Fe3+-dicitrate
MLGYATGNLPFDLAKGGSVQLAVSLAAAALALDTIKVSATDGMTPAMRGFEERRHRGSGKFFTRADITKMQARNFTDILRRVPGMQIQTVSSMFGAGEAVRSPRIAGGISNRTCPMMFYINGAPFPMNQDYTINQFVSTDDVAAVEVYSGSSEIPPQFNSGMASAPCGVVLIWIRDGKNEPAPGR